CGAGQSLDQAAQSRAIAVCLDIDHLALAPVQEDAEEDAGAKSDADGLIGILSNIDVGSFRSLACAHFEFAAGFFGDFERSGQLLPRCGAAFTQGCCSGAQQFFAILNDSLEVL